MKRRIELILGIFVFIGLVLLGIMIVGFGDYQYAGKQYQIYAVFNYISGVVEGAPIRYAGVDVGKVMKAKLFETPEGNTKVKLGLGINEGVNIKKGSEAVINSLGIIGEKYVEIFPGAGVAEVLQSGDEIIGIDPVALENVMSRAQRVLGRLEDALGAVNNILTDKTREDIETTIVNFKNFSFNMERLTNKAEQIIDKINTEEGTVGQLIYAQELYDELLALIKGIREHGIFYKAKSARKELQKGVIRKQQFGPRK